MGGIVDAFVSKLNSAGSALLFSTYLGGRGIESGPHLAVDSDFIYVTGTTGSTDFPTHAAEQPELRAGTDMFVARIRAANGALDSSTYWGGSGIDTAAGCAVDVEGNLYVVGRSRSSDLPTVNAAQALPGGGNDAVVLKIGREERGGLMRSLQSHSRPALWFTFAVAVAGVLAWTRWGDRRRWMTGRRLVSGWPLGCRYCRSISRPTAVRPTGGWRFWCGRGGTRRL
jgi:hypothetical protein